MALAADIAARLGRAFQSGQWWRCPCPVHGGTSPLALRDSASGLVVHCHAGCDASAVRLELANQGLLDEAAVTGGLFWSQNPDDQAAAYIRRLRRAQVIWDGASAAERTPVSPYLARRGILIPIPSTLRWVLALRRLDSKDGPAMVARVDDVAGNLVGIHRTWLSYRDGSWQRLDRAALGRVAGAAVRLGQPVPGTPLLVSEGIETGLSAQQMTGWPCWAALSASGLVQLRDTISNYLILFILF